LERRPVIGIATQTLEAIPGQLPACWVMGQKYVRTLTAAGGVPWVIPLQAGDEATLRATYEGLDGVFLTGGVDVDPSQYHETRHRLCGRSDPPRDWTELRLVRWAIEDHKPILGVCRGIQIVNVACGGTLYQDLNFEYPRPIRHDYFPSVEDGFTRDMIAHTIAIKPDTRLARILANDQAEVNSMHHQGIKDLAPGLVISAQAPDGVVEAAEGANGQFLVAVQWHPEELAESQPGMRRLFEAFIAAAREFGGGARARAA
jgi:putative glutamine amidotransferase